MCHHPNLILLWNCFPISEPIQHFSYPSNISPSHSIKHPLQIYRHPQQIYQMAQSFRFTLLSSTLSTSQRHAKFTSMRSNVPHFHFMLNSSSPTHESYLVLIRRIAMTFHKLLYTPHTYIFNFFYYFYILFLNSNSLLMTE